MNSAAPDASAGLPPGGSWQRHGSGAVAPLVAVGLVALVTALLAREPWIVLVGVPALVVLALDVVVPAPPQVTISAEVDQIRVNEGALIEVTYRLVSTRSGVLRIDFGTSGGAEITDHSHREVEVVAGVERTETVLVRFARWGLAEVNVAELGWPSALGLVEWRSTPNFGRRVWVHPALAPARSRFGVARTGLRAGQHLSSQRGGGVEYHSSRLFESGDRWRDIDHRTSARRNELWTRTRHAERARDLVLVVDFAADVGHTSGRVADQVVRLADAIARDHLADRDRVGLILIGQHLRTLAPAEGSRQRERIVELLVKGSTRSGGSRTRVGLTRLIAPGSTIVILSPLIDRGLVTEVLGLRRQGRDVVVVRLGSDLVERYRSVNDGLERAAASLRIIEDNEVIADLESRGVVVSDISLDEALSSGLDRAQLRHQVAVRSRRRP